MTKTFYVCVLWLMNKRHGTASYGISIIALAWVFGLGISIHSFWQYTLYASQCSKLIICVSLKSPLTWIIINPMRHRYRVLFMATHKGHRHTTFRGTDRLLDISWGNSLLHSTIYTWYRHCFTLKPGMAKPVALRLRVESFREGHRLLYVLAGSGCSWVVVWQASPLTWKGTSGKRA